MENLNENGCQDCIKLRKDRNEIRNKYNAIYKRLERLEKKLKIDTDPYNRILELNEELRETKAMNNTLLKRPIVLTRQITDLEEKIAELNLKIKGQ